MLLKIKGKVGIGNVPHTQTGRFSAFICRSTRGYLTAQAVSSVHEADADPSACWWTALAADRRFEPRAGWSRLWRASRRRGDGSQGNARVAYIRGHVCATLDLGERLH